MLRAISVSDYKKSGCINCGCDFCYNQRGISGGGVAPAKCGECQKEFIILADGMKKSTIGFGTDKKDEKGETIFEYPILGEHPRKGIKKHKFVRPDVRPENSIGDFCNPRGVGYDLACFVKSKEAGQRITDMINRVNKEYNDKGFSCWLDYRKKEPLWIQVKIQYPSELRASILSQLIRANGNIITEELIRQAIDMEINFANYWKYKARHRVHSAVEISFMNSIVAAPDKLTKEERDNAYRETFQRNNHLDQFEVWGAYKQIELEIEKGNIGNAVAIARHLIDLNGTPFNFELMVQREKERDYITNLRKYFHDELVYLVNIYNKQSKQPEEIKDGDNSCDYWLAREKTNISDDMKPQFLSDWQKVVSLIFSVIDLESIKMSTDWRNKKSLEDLEKEKQTLSKYSNLYGMFSLFGLYVYVSRQLEENQYRNSVLAIKHVANQMRSPLFLKLQALTKNNDVQALRIQSVYCQIANMATKYYSEQPETKKHEGPVKTLQSPSQN